VSGGEHSTSAGSDLEPEFSAGTSSVGGTFAAFPGEVDASRALPGGELYVCPFDGSGKILPGEALFPLYPCLGNGGRGESGRDGRIVEVGKD